LHSLLGGEGGFDMLSMRLGLAIGFVALSSLGVACSTQTTTTLEDVPVGEEDPGAAAAAEQTTTAEEQTGEGAATQPASSTPAAPAAEAPKPKSKMTFFVTSTGSGAAGGNLGGLEGADKKCTDLAAAAGGGDHTWHAYLSVQGKPAKDRIGPGPWVNQAGKQIAADVGALHAYAFVPATADMLDEKGQPVPAKGRMILTGTKQDGTPLNATCNNWTSNAGNQNARVGDASSDTSPVLGVRWNDSTKAYACSQQAIAQNKGEGRIYCFAID
jgi:hypothetical protein